MAAILPLQPGADPEVTLEALIDAAGLLQEHLTQLGRTTQRAGPERQVIHP